MKIEIQLPDKAIKALASGKPWAGTAEVAVTPGKGGRIALLADTAKATKARRHHTLAPDEKKVVEAWNDNKYIKKAVHESRNNPITPAQVHGQLGVIRRALAELGTDYILDSMGQYFASCEKGEHIWDRKNHGFSHLGGFLSGLLRRHKASQQPWWHAAVMPKMGDENPELTAKIADAFAVKFLNRGRYRLENPSPEYRAFSGAADRIRRMAEGGRVPLGEAEIILQVMACVAANHHDESRAVKPSVLGRTDFWKVWLPQHLKRLG